MERLTSQVSRQATCLVVGLLLAGHSASAWVDRDEVSLTGRFFDNETQEELVVRRMTHSLEIVRAEATVWQEGFYAYLSDILGTCRDLDTGRDQIFYATSSGGSDGAMTINFLAAGPDGALEMAFTDRTASPELGRYFRWPEPPADSEWLEPVPGMICAAEEYMAQRQRGLQVYRALAPAPVPLEVGDGDRLVPQTLVSRDLEPALVESVVALHEDLGEGFFHATLAETAQWRFELVGFYHFYASWGVVLLEDKTTGRWRSIRDVPRGDSKSFLLEPEITAIDADSARIDFCAVCPNWPAGPEAVLDLRTLEVRPLGESPTQ